MLMSLLFTLLLPSELSSCGAKDGVTVGADDGSALGITFGVKEGTIDGIEVGTDEGRSDGEVVGTTDGTELGEIWTSIPQQVHLQASFAPVLIKQRS